MKKFNNTLKGRDCGDAGLPANSHEIAKPKTMLRVIPRILEPLGATTCLGLRQTRGPALGFLRVGPSRSLH
jgi:hypothetical protein